MHFEFILNWLKLFSFVWDVYLIKIEMCCKTVANIVIIF